MTQESNTRLVKIGELLIEVGVLSSGDLTEAIQISKRMGVPIGRVLVMSGCVNEANLQYALELQSLLKDGLVDWETGMKALKKVFTSQTDLQSALKDLNWAPRLDAAGNKLGDLLIDSSIVTKNQLEKALETSFQSGMPLGGTLVLQGVLSPQLLPTVLHIQEQIRDGKLTRDEAIDTLKQAVMFWARAIDQTTKDDLQGMPRPAEAATPQPAAVAQTAPAPTQQGHGGSAHPFLAQQQPAATAPASAPGVPAPPPPPPPPPRPPAPPQHVPQNASQQPSVFDNAGTAHGGAQQSFVSPSPAQMQRPVQASPAPQQALVAPNQAPEASTQVDPVSLVELMKLSGFCSQATLNESINNALNDSRLASKMLLAIGFLDGPMLNNFVHCQALIARGKIRTDQALFILNSIRHRKISLEQAISEMGIDATL